MIRYLNAQEVLHLHQRTIERTGGRAGLRDASLLEAVLNRPRAAFGGAEVHPTLAAKAAVLMYSLVLNHLFVDGNKRIGLLCLEAFLRLNGMRLEAGPEERYRLVLDVASESLTMDAIRAWVEQHARPAPSPSRETRPSGARTRVRRRLTITSPASQPPGDDAP
ncbi:MAG: type II toxin-antitoxin system death-on-curing family toxin [Armatimonadetes bacterium]|nr:type II toxin-antitoxin system death-on-curing family toxin [Armatimonadota bacterium]